MSVQICTLLTPEQRVKGSMFLDEPLGNAVLVLVFLLHANLMVDKSFLQSRKRNLLVLVVERLVLVLGVEQSRLWSGLLSFMSNLGSHFSG